jgi:hypothetical protein
MVRSLRLVLKDGDDGPAPGVVLDADQTGAAQGL